MNIFLHSFVSKCPTVQQQKYACTGLVEKRKQYLEVVRSKNKMSFLKTTYIFIFIQCFEQIELEATYQKEYYNFQLLIMHQEKNTWKKPSADDVVYHKVGRIPMLRIEFIYYSRLKTLKSQELRVVEVDKASLISIFYRTIFRIYLAFFSSIF